jgi:hypothetical protein
MQMSCYGEILSGNSSPFTSESNTSADDHEQYGNYPFLTQSEDVDRAKTPAQESILGAGYRDAWETSNAKGLLHSFMSRRERR